MSLQSGLLTTWAGATLSFDANGNLASDGPTSYGWNVRSQLTNLSGEATASFSYDSVGRRRVKATGGTGTSFLFDRNNLVQELSAGVPTANMLNALGVDEWF